MLHAERSALSHALSRGRVSFHNHLSPASMPVRQNRNNANRLFDSQNNNKGGYSVGVDNDDYTDAGIALPPRGPILDGDPAKPLAITTAGNMALAGPNGDGYRQPPLQLELGSVLPIEWTNQHACGPNDKTLCETVLQYMCDATDPGQGAPGLRDGERTGCPNNNDQCPPLDNDNDITDTTFGTRCPVAKDGPDQFSRGQPASVASPLHAPTTELQHQLQPLLLLTYLRVAAHDAAVRYFVFLMLVG